MKNLIFASIILTMGSAPLSAKEVAVANCEITYNTVMDKTNKVKETVEIPLTQNYRYLEGHAEFNFLGWGSEIDILTWGGKGGQVSQNNFRILGMKVESVGMSTRLMTDDIEISVACTLN